MKKKRTRKWFDETGMADDWLRENDPLWGSPKDRNYLTADQFKYRAKKKETPTNPMVVRDLLERSSYGETVNFQDTKRQIRESKELVLDLE